LNLSQLESPWLSLIIPTYNERDNIAPLLARVYKTLTRIGQRFEIIVVDDDSPDKTWEVVEGLRQNYGSLRLIRRCNERGLARAVVRGWQEASGRILAVIDADLQHPPETLLELIKAISSNEVDIAVASRHTQGGGVSDWNLLRRLVSWGATLAATWFLPGTLCRVRDPMSGYFAIRRSVIQDSELNPEGYKILLEVLARGHYRTVAEIPYTFIERERGGSKLGAQQCFEFVRHLLRLSWDTGDLKRFVKYCVVGATGILVNTVTLAVAVSAGLGYLGGGAVALESAIISNFMLNDFWTFKNVSMRDGTLGSRLRRFFQFNSFCLAGGIIYVLILNFLSNHTGLHYLVSSFIGMTVSTFWNYGMNANITWLSRERLFQYDDLLKRQMKKLEIPL
jgi:dolichol-phosphate mannosyltransferase